MAGCHDLPCWREVSGSGKHALAEAQATAVSLPDGCQGLWLGPIDHKIWVTSYIFSGEIHMLVGGFLIFQ
jgi:hypothetical protein